MATNMLTPVIHHSDLPEMGIMGGIPTNPNGRFVASQKHIEKQHILRDSYQTCGKGAFYGGVYGYKIHHSILGYPPVSSNVAIENPPSFECHPLRPVRGFWSHPPKKNTT